MTTRRKPTTRPLALSLMAALVLLMALAAPAGAVSYLESAYGAQSPWLSAELNSLGGSGGAVYRGGFSALLNPAGLAHADRWRVDAGVGLDHHEEERFAPLFDSFDNRVIDASIASNQKTWLQTGFAVAGRFGLGNLPLGFGLSLADRYPFSYEFTEEVRDPSFASNPRDALLEERTYEVEGTLRTLSLGLAGEASNVAIGAAVHYAFGDRDVRWLLRDHVTLDGDRSIDSLHAWDLSGVNATVGLQVRANERLTLAVAYETPLAVDGERTIDAISATDTTLTAAGNSLEYPAYWRFGAAMYPRHDPRTVLTVDVVYSDWTELADDRAGIDDSRLTAPGQLQEVVDVRVGLRHRFRSGQDMNVGFRRYDSYNDDEGGNSVFSAGTAWPIGPGRLGVSLELSKLQTADVPNIYAYPAGYDSPSETRVEDLRLRLGLGWTHTF